MIRIAVLDGQQLLLDVMPSMFSGSEIEVVAAVPTWPQLLAHPGYPPEVVVLDARLDDVPAEARIRTLRDDGARVVVLSTVTDVVRVRGYLAAGAHAFVLRSDDGATVVGAVLAAARGRQYLSPGVRGQLHPADDVPAVPALSPQEARTLSLYASGLPLKNVARVLGVSYETAKSYLDRVRDKYRKAGRTAGTKFELRTRALEDGHLVD